MKLDKIAVEIMLETYSDPIQVCGASYYVIANLCQNALRLLKKKDTDNGNE